MSIRKARRALRDSLGQPPNGNARRSGDNLEQPLCCGVRRFSGSYELERPARLPVYPGGGTA